MSLPASSYHRHVKQCRALKGFCQLYETMVQHTLFAGDIVQRAYEVERVVKAGDAKDNSEDKTEDPKCLCGCGYCNCLQKKLPNGTNGGSSVGGSSVGGSSVGGSSDGDGDGDGDGGSSVGGAGGDGGDGDADVTIVCVVEGKEKKIGDDDLVMIGIVEGDKDGDENGDGDEEISFLGMVMGDSSLNRYMQRRRNEEEKL